jgi:hypothetical protein
LLQKLAESFISPVFETSESCKKLQKIAIPDRKTRLIKALQADTAKKQLPRRGPYDSNLVLKERCAASRLPR